MSRELCEKAREGGLASLSGEELRLLLALLKERALLREVWEAVTRPRPRGPYR